MAEREKQQEQPQAFVVERAELEFLIQWCQSVPLPRNTTDQPVMVLQKISERPVPNKPTK